MFKEYFSAVTSPPSYELPWLSGDSTPGPLSPSPSLYPLHHTEYLVLVEHRKKLLCYPGRIMSFSNKTLVRTNWKSKLAVFLFCKNHSNLLAMFTYRALRAVHIKGYRVTWTVETDSSSLLGLHNTNMLWRANEHSREHREVQKKGRRSSNSAIQLEVCSHYTGWTPVSYTHLTLPTKA